MSENYKPPLDQLLDYGIELGFQLEWPDYLSMGFDSTHVPDLLRMVNDESLYFADEELPESIATIHAWRTLGQLKAPAAIEPLIKLLTKYQHDDWLQHELPKVLAMIGPASLPEADKVFSAEWDDEFPAISATAVLSRMVELHPDTLGDCRDICLRHLANHANFHPAINACLVGNLLDWDCNQPEVVSIIESVYASGNIDTMLCGDWEDAQVALGLLEKRLTPRRIYSTDRSGKQISRLAQKPTEAVPKNNQRNSSKKKNKRKTAKKSRKQQRKKRKK